MNKIDAIMEEAEIQLYDNGDSGASDMSNLRAILEKHLQDTTEEREVTLKISDLEWFEYEGCYCKCGRIIAENQEECDCGAKIKRIA